MSNKENKTGDNEEVIDRKFHEQVTAVLSDMISAQTEQVHLLQKANTYLLMSVCLAADANNPPLEKAIYTTAEELESDKYTSPPPEMKEALETVRDPAVIMCVNRYAELLSKFALHQDSYITYLKQLQDLRSHGKVTEVVYH